MARTSTLNKIIDKLRIQDEGVQWYFALLPELLENISSSRPALAYCFQQIEGAQRVSIYALLMREYRTDSELTWVAVDRIDITRKNFPELFENISGKKLEQHGRSILEKAEKTRDHITHGRDASEAEVRLAILKCLEYVEFLNSEFGEKVGFRPVGQLRGVTSKRGRPQLDKKISRAVLKGLGLPV